MSTMRLPLAIIACLFSVLVAAFGQVDSPDAARERAVDLARQGRLDQALTILESLHRAAPANRAIAHDYIVVLGWAGRNRDAVALFRRIGRDDAPEYVIEAAARASRHLGSYGEALDLYRYGQSRWPHDSGFAVGEVHTLVDAGDLNAAAARAERLAIAWPDDADVLAAKARVLQVRGYHADALAVATRALALKPDHRDALRMRVLALSESGSPELALILARKQPGLMTEAELQRIEANATAYRIRSARAVRPTSESERFADVDQALAELDRQIAELAPDPSAGAALLTARYDRIVALRDRYRMQEVIDEYRLLAAEGNHPPSYVLAAVGDALLHLRRPEEALALYREGLRSAPESFETQLQMAYALADIGEFGAAIELIDRLNEEQPIWIQTVDGRSLLENPRRLATERARAAIRLYADDLDGAGTLFARMADQAPRNSLGYEGLGDVYLARGWPRRALAEFEQGLAVERQNREPRGSIDPTYGLEARRAFALYRIREYRQVEEQVSRLAARYPEQLEVRRLVREWDVHNRRELQLEADAGFNEGDAPQVGDRSLSFSSTLFSAPFATNYRAFIGYRFAEAKFDDVGAEMLHRVFAGLDYRRADWELIGEASYNTNGATEPGGRIEALWNPDDHWSLGGSLEFFSRDTPLRALADGVTANSAALEGAYKASDEFEVIVAGKAVDFSDGNLRQQAELSARTRALTRPYFRIDGGIDVSVSRNSETDVSYFSPELDSAQTGSVIFSHTLYRRYEDVYVHTLTVMGGNYWQRDFGHALIGSVFYEHRLRANDVIDVGFGIGYRHLVFDGEPEEQLAALTRLMWRF